jgi:hypothetical protein
MTTVVFDGKILAADSRCTVFHNTTEEVCTNCATSANRTIKSYVKLRVPKKPVKFKGQTVAAVTGAGATDWTHGILHCIENELDIAATLTAMSMFVANTSRPRLVFSGRVMVVTVDGACWLLETEGNKLKETEIKEFPISIGSGSKAAMTAIKFMGLSPVEAVMVASDIDESTGGDVSWISLDAPEKLETVKFKPGFADKFKKASKTPTAAKTPAATQSSAPKRSNPAAATTAKALDAVIKHTKENVKPKQLAKKPLRRGEAGLKSTQETKK